MTLPLCWESQRWITCLPHHVSRPASCDLDSSIPLTHEYLVSAYCGTWVLGLMFCTWNLVEEVSSSVLPSVGTSAAHLSLLCHEGFWGPQNCAVLLKCFHPVSWVDVGEAHASLFHLNCRLVSFKVEFFHFGFLTESQIPVVWGGFSDWEITPSYHIDTACNH